MLIALDVSPVSKKSTSAHKIRGVGRYINLLTENLQKYDKKNTYIFSSDIKRVKDADLIHYPYFDPFFLTLPLYEKRTTIVTVHDLIPIVHGDKFPSGVKGGLKWRINKFLLKKLEGVITDSQASKKAIIEKAGIGESKIFPVHLCVSDCFKTLTISNKDKRAIVEKYNLPDKFFLYVGDVTWNKNLPRLIQAVKKVGIPLVMVGKALTQEFDGSSLWNCDRLYVENETSSDLFTKTGYVSDEDLVKIYNLSIALCMPSLDEGFGLPVLEAMQSGCPVLTSKKGSLPEVGGDAVLYADAESTEDIAENLQKLQNSAIRKDFIARGEVQAKKFTTRKFVEDTIAVYDKIGSPTSEK